MRPKDWAKIKKAILEGPDGVSRYCCDVCGDKIIEATFDAMMEALKKEGVYVEDSVSCALTVSGVPGVFTFHKGYLVFIKEG